MDIVMWKGGRTVMMGGEKVACQTSYTFYDFMMKWCGTLMLLILSECYARKMIAIAPIYGCEDVYRILLAMIGNYVIHEKLFPSGKCLVYWQLI